MPQAVGPIFSAFMSAAYATGSAVAGTLIGAGVGAAAAKTVGLIIGVSATALNVIGGVMSVASALGLGQKQPELQSTWSRTQLSIEAAPGMRVAVGETAVAGILRANFQTGRKKEIFSEVIALSAAGPIGAIHGPIIERQLYTVNTTGTGLTQGSCSYAPNDMWVYRNLGGWDQASLAPWPGHGSVSQPPGWSSNHRGLGCAHVFAVYRENPEAYPKGKPVPLWRVSGHTNVIDPRTGTTASPEARDLAACWEYTWRLGLKTPTGQPLINAGIPLGGYHKTTEQLDTAAYAAWANRCEELGLKVSGQIDLTDDDPEAVSRAFLQAGCATYVLKGGRDSVFYQAPKVSVGTITEADLMGPVSVKTSPEIRDRPNSIVPKFVSEAHGFEMVPGSAITDAAYQTEDGGLREAELPLPMVLGEEQAAIVAAYQLIQSRERLYVQGSFHPRVLAFAPGDAITLNLPRLGISGVKCVIEGRAIGKSGAITLAMRSETDAKHDWATGQTTTVPDLTIPQLATGEAPAPEAGQWTATAATITSSGTTLPIIRVSGSSSDYPQGSAVVLRYRLAASGSPWLGEFTLGMDATIAELDTVTPGTAYVVGVAYRNGYGREGPILELASVTTGGFVAGNTAPQPDNRQALMRPLAPGNRDVALPGLDGWEVVDVSDRVLTGSVARRAISAGTFTAEGPLWPVQGGEAVSASVYVAKRGQWLTGELEAAVRFFDVDGVPLGFELIEAWEDGETVGTDQRMLARSNITAPVGAVSASVCIGVFGATGTGFVEWWRGYAAGGATPGDYNDHGTGDVLLTPEVGKNIAGPDGVILSAGELLNTLSPRIEGPASTTVQADFRGVALAGQLPRTLQVRLWRGTEDVSASASWSLTAMGSTATVTSGTVELTAVAGSGSITVSALLDGVTYRQVIEVVKINAAPPVTGGGGATTAVDTTISSTSSTSLVTVGGPLTVRAGSAGQIAFSASCTFTTTSAFSASAAMRIRYRAVGAGSWSWAAAEVSSSVSARGGTEPELGEIDASTTLTGLTSGTDYECELQARSPSGATVFFEGSFTAEAT